MNISKIIGEQAVAQLKRKRNVVLIGTGVKRTKGEYTNRLAIIIGVTEKVPISQLSIEDIIPAQINSIPTDVEPIGKIEFLPDKAPVDRIKEFRPVPGGVSMGEKTITAGTGNSIHKKGKLLFLSNNHVFAACNKAPIGSEILQPGPYDGGTVDNHTVGKLSEFVPILMDNGTSKCHTANIFVRILNILARVAGSDTRIPLPVKIQTHNLVDCALAEPVDSGIILDAIIEDDGNYIKPAGEEEPYIDLLVKKSGRTTGTTHSIVTIVDATIMVSMGDGNTATFDDQIGIKNPFGAGGDSGSIVLSEHSEFVGLLFAGSSSITFANRWGNVRKILGLDEV